MRTTTRRSSLVRTGTTSKWFVTRPRPRPSVNRARRLMAFAWRGTARGDSCPTRYSARLRNALSLHIQDLLNRGIPVVLDFPGNTRTQRQWFRAIVEGANVEHELHFIDVSFANTNLGSEAQRARLPHT
jgi:hypothetical protein